MFRPAGCLRRSWPILPRRPNAGRDIQSAGTGKVFPQNAKKAQEDKSPRLPDQECLPIGQRALAEAVVKSKVPALVARWRDGGWRRVEYAADLGSAADANVRASCCASSAPEVQALCRVTMVCCLRRRASVRRRFSHPRSRSRAAPRPRSTGSLCRATLRPAQARAARSHGSSRAGRGRGCRQAPYRG